MPQFETERPGEPLAVLRARDAADAARRAWDVPAEATVDLGPAEGPSGWMGVTVEGEAVGRVRPHARMRFRRD